uniref:Uncharacterized protein n=1 Tax=Sphaerodactylus townsendi TaxID=933632 RepID=A0ACB8F439_9SAUR
MTSQSQGIQQLLQAEKRAKDKLEEAKKMSLFIWHRVTGLPDYIYFFLSYHCKGFSSPQIQMHRSKKTSLIHSCRGLWHIWTDAEVQFA